MCAGDLGMYRVMPWAYPPISGGSSGGFSPDDSGGGSGSVVPNTLFVRTDDTVTSIYNALNQTSSNRIVVYYSAGLLGVGNLNGIVTVARNLVLDELYFADNPSVNNVGVLKTNVSGGSFTVPVTDWINKVGNYDVYFDFSAARTDNVVAVVGHLDYLGYDADGNLVRKTTFSMNRWDSS